MKVKKVHKQIRDQRNGVQMLLENENKLNLAMRKHSSCYIIRKFLVQVYVMDLDECLRLTRLIVMLSVGIHPVIHSILVVNGNH